MTFSFSARLYSMMTGHCSRRCRACRCARRGPSRCCAPLQETAPPGTYLGDLRSVSGADFSTATDVPVNSWTRLPVARNNLMSLTRHPPRARRSSPSPLPRVMLFGIRSALRSVHCRHVSLNDYTANRQNETAIPGKPAPVPLPACPPARLPVSFASRGRCGRGRSSCGRRRPGGSRPGRRGRGRRCWLLRP